MRNRSIKAPNVIRNQAGQNLTKASNRFHDPEERSPDIHQLRTLLAAMDRAVLAAYGWPEIPTAREFLLDYEEDEDPDTEPSPTAKRKGKPKKKPYRCRWPDEVLARLLTLNAERVEQERLAGTGKGNRTIKTAPGKLQQTINQRDKSPDELL